MNNCRVFTGFKHSLLLHWKVFHHLCCSPSSRFPPPPLSLRILDSPSPSSSCFSSVAFCCSVFVSTFSATSFPAPTHPLVHYHTQIFSLTHTLSPPPSIQGYGSPSDCTPQASALFICPFVKTTAATHGEACTSGCSTASFLSSCCYMWTAAGESPKYVSRVCYLHQSWKGNEQREAGSAVYSVVLRHVYGHKYSPDSRFIIFMFRCSCF